MISSTQDGDTPGANTVYSGTPLGGAATGTGPTAYENGNLWSIALYAAPGINNTTGVKTAEAVNAYSATSLFENSGGTGIANAGVNGNDSAGAWSGYARSQALGYGPPTQGFTTAAPDALYPNSAFSSSATVQLEVWYNGGAQNLSYAQAAADGDPYGASSFESINPLGLLGNLLTIPPTLGGYNNEGGDLVPGDGLITSFSLIEEPKVSESNNLLNTLEEACLGLIGFVLLSKSTILLRDRA